MNFSKFFCLFMLMVVVVSIFSVGFSFGYDSELNDYSFYKIIGYEAGVGAGVDYQVVVVVHYGSGTDGTMSLNGETVALVHVGDIQADFDDVRFTNGFGEVLTHKRCSYVSAVNATFVVKVEADLDVDQFVYVYYANPLAVDASSNNTLVSVISDVVGSWNMEEANAADNVLDYSGNNQDGVPTALAVVASPFFTGKNAKSFVADNNRAYFSNWGQQALTVGSIQMAFKPTSLATAEQTLFCYFDSWDDYLAIFLNDVGNLVVRYMKNGVNVADKVFATGLLINTPYHIAVVQDGVNLSVYKNGALVSSTAYSSWFPDVDITANADMSIGDLATFSEFSGVMQNYFVTSTVPALIPNLLTNYADFTLVAGSVLVRKWATTTLPTVADISEQISNVEVTPSPSVVPISEGELSNAMLYVLGFMVVMCVVGLVWLGRVPVVVLLVGLFAVLVGLYCVLGGVYGLGVGQGWFALFVVVFGGLTMLLTGLGVRVKR